MLNARDFIRSLPSDSDDYRWLVDAYDWAARNPDWAAELFDALLDTPTEIPALNDVVRLHITDAALETRAVALLRAVIARPNDQRRRHALDLIVAAQPHAIRNVLDDYLDWLVKVDGDCFQERSQCRRAARPWRACSKAEIANLMRRSPSSTAEARLVWHALIWSRDEDALHHAWDLDGKHKSGYDTFTFWDEVCHAGIESTGLGKPYARLMVDRPLYVKWKPDYLGVSVAPILPAVPTFDDVHWHRHPTRAFEPDIPGEFRFGGPANGACGVCGEPLHHLLTLDPIPEPLKQLITSVPRVELATCLSCCGCESPMLFFVHDDNGAVAGPWATLTRRRTPEVPATHFKHTTVRLGHTSPRWDVPDMNDSRVGGEHYDYGWSDAYPKCEGCAKRMSFVFQFGELAPRVDGEHHMFGDGGSLFAYWCDRCRVSANHFESS